MKQEDGMADFKIIGEGWATGGIGSPKPVRDTRIAAAERAVVEAAIVWQQHWNPFDIAKRNAVLDKVAELLRLRAVQASQGSGE